MAVEFIRQLHRKSLEKAWNARPAKAPRDPMPRRRQGVLSRIDSALAQLAGGETSPRRGLYQRRDNFNGMRVQLKCGQHALKIDGRDHWFVEDAATFFKSARQAVENGELDDAINDALEAKGKAKGTRPAPRRKPPVAERGSIPVAPPDGKAAADDMPAARPGKYAQKYEKLLAAGIISEPAL